MSAMTDVELAVLDLAGTTVSDPGVVEAAVRKVAGRSFDPVAFDAHRGGSKLDMLAALLGSGAAIDALAALEGHLLAAVESGAIEPLPHADEALARLADARIKICLTTGFPATVRDALVVTLGWQHVVDLALSPGAGCRGRPWPDLILTAMLRLEATAVDAVAVVGDTANDVTAARRAGAGMAAAVLTGAHDRATLEAAGPSHLVEHIGQFADLLVAPS